MALKPGPLRDAVVLVVVFAFLLGGLYAYTQTWPPAVIVESSSMMHKECAEGIEPPQCNPSVRYGRLGTIDPGDLVLVKEVEDPDDVRTLLDGGRERYGKAGDVVIYFPENNRQLTPIIHRAVAYVEVRGSGIDMEYWVRWNADVPCEGNSQKRESTWCVFDANGVLVPSVPIARLGSTAGNPQPYKPEHTGFLTKGDNPSTNRNIDQVSGLSRTVKLEWLEGKGRAELPWLGLIKLSIANKQNERSPPAEWVKIGSAYAPKDLWVMLGISLFVLVGIPLIYDGYKAIQTRRGRRLPPQPPRELTAIGGAGSVTLTWAAVPNATMYRVYRGPNVVGQTTETTYTEGALAAGFSYVYTVAAVDPDGKEGSRSRTAAAMPEGEAPAGTAAT